MKFALAACLLVVCIGPIRGTAVGIGTTRLTPRVADEVLEPRDGVRPFDPISAPR